MKTLFLTAWLQVFLVALNTYQVAQGKWLGALVVGFGISLVWTLNIKRIAFAGWKDRLVYSTGAMCGTGTGILAANLFY
jgi:hypothetical protein